MDREPHGKLLLARRRRPRAAQRHTIVRDTGTETLAITADHVYAAYLNDLEAGRVFECQFGSVLVRPETMLIARDAHLDVATCRMPTVAYLSCRRALLRPSSPWTRSRPAGP